MDVKALIFDTFGTVVDWRGSIIKEGYAWGKARGINIDWALKAEETQLIRAREGLVESRLAPAQALGGFCPRADATEEEIHDRPLLERQCGATQQHGEALRASMGSDLGR